MDDSSNQSDKLIFPNGAEFNLGLNTETPLCGLNSDPPDKLQVRADRTHGKTHDLINTAINKMVQQLRTFLDADLINLSHIPGFNPDDYAVVSEWIPSDGRIVEVIYVALKRDDGTVERMGPVRGIYASVDPHIIQFKVG